MKTYDIAVIGGGASGLAAAIAAKRTDSSLKIALLERLPRVGKKILATGNGRCNLTNRNLSRERYYGSCRNTFWELTQRYPAEEFFASMGVLCTADEEGRVYPNSNNAASVLDALRIEADNLGIDTICDFDVCEIRKGFIIRSSDAEISAKRVILAGGGMSQQSLGSNGSLLRLCRDIGITVRRLTPALTSVKTDINLVKSLKGQRVQAKVSAYISGGEAKSEYGEVQFGDGVISGICVFNLTCLGAIEQCELHLDLMPDMNFNELYLLLKKIKSIRKNAVLEDFLSGIINKRIGMYVLKKCTDKPLTECISALDDKELKKIAETIKKLVFPIKGLSGFEKSQVTSGGVAFSEIDESLCLKKINGMYVCGEMLDIIGECGGFNLAFAFASGQHAGICAAKGIK